MPYVGSFWKGGPWGKTFLQKCFPPGKAFSANLLLLVGGLGENGLEISGFGFHIRFGSIRVGVDDDPSPHTWSVGRELERMSSFRHLEQYIGARGTDEHDIESVPAFFPSRTSPVEVPCFAHFNGWRRSRLRTTEPLRGVLFRPGDRVAPDCSGARKKQQKKGLGSNLTHQFIQTLHGTVPAAFFRRIRAGRRGATFKDKRRSPFSSPRFS